MPYGRLLCPEIPPRVLTIPGYFLPQGISLHGGNIVKWKVTSAGESLLCAMYNGGSSGRGGKLPLPSSHDQTKLIAAGADPTSAILSLNGSSLA